MPDMKNVTLFKVKEQTFAYETELILETVKVENIYPVPQAPYYLEGVVNLRNKVIPVVNLGSLLWCDAISSDTLVIVGVEGEQVGLLVDRVLGIADIEESELKSKEEIEIKDLREDLIEWVFERDGDVVFALNLKPVLENARNKKKDKRKKSKGSGEQSKPSQIEEKKGFVIFPLGEEWFAFPVEEVREIIGYPGKVSRIPRSPEYVEGVFLLRGEELVLISLRRLLGIDSQSEEQRVIILNLGGFTLGVAVDDVKEIKWVSPDSIISHEYGGVLVLDEGSRLAYLLKSVELFRDKEIDEFVEKKELEEDMEVKNMKSFVRFNLGKIDMAVPINKVKEVIEIDELTPLPGAPIYVRGMYNLRNSVIVIIDLAIKLGVKGSNNSDRVIVLEDMPVGMVVSKLRGILKVEEDRIQPAENLAGMEENLLEGIIKTEDGGIIFILDVDKVVHEEDLKLIKEEAVENG